MVVPNFYKIKMSFNLLKKKLREEEGATMAEYALLLGLIIVLTIVTIEALSTRISTVISKATTSLAS